MLFQPGREGESGGGRAKPEAQTIVHQASAMNEEALRKILMEEPYRTIKINDGDGEVSVPMVQAILHAQALFIRLLGTSSRRTGGCTTMIRRRAGL
jgi:hypothetical protein